MILRLFSKSITLAAALSFSMLASVSAFSSATTDSSEAIEQSVDAQTECPHGVTDQESDHKNLPYDEVLGNLKKLPHRIQSALLQGMNLNIMTLIIFAQMGRNKAYLFDKDKPSLRNFFAQNLEAKLRLLSECPDADFDSAAILDSPSQDEDELDSEDELDPEDEDLN